ncbi:MAG: pseudouridine synthase [Calditrichia bacterium]
MDKIRLNKFIADCGYTSRRKADELILSSLVRVNDHVVTNPATRVHPKHDKVEVEGKVIKLERKRVVIALHKPRGVITTVEDEKNRKTVMDLIDIPYRVFPVGRLDRDTSGLLLLTNDGELANRIMHPSYEIKKEYIVETDAFLMESDIRQIQKGMLIEGKKTSPAHIEIVDNAQGKPKYRIRIHEGFNRQIRKMMESLGYKTIRLKRVKLGNITLGSLAPGKWRYLSHKEILVLKKICKMR